MMNTLITELGDCLLYVLNTRSIDDHVRKVAYRYISEREKECDPKRNERIYNPMSFNITLSELIELTEFAKKNGEHEFGTVSIEVYSDGIGNSFRVKGKEGIEKSVYNLESF